MKKLSRHDGYWSILKISWVKKQKNEEVFRRAGKDKLPKALSEEKLS